MAEADTAVVDATAIKLTIRPGVEARAKKNRIPLARSSAIVPAQRFSDASRLVCGVPAMAGTARCPNRLMKEMPVEVEGVIHTVLPGTMFRVELDNKHLVLATISGKMRKRWVRLTVGDRVKMEMSPYDLDKARIVWRLQ